jgi:hypothetical protein
LFFSIAFDFCYSQNDSDKFRVGPEELQVTRGGRYFNYADKNKVNIEVTVICSFAGKYLIPQGTNLFDFLIMVGGTGSEILEDIKIVRFKSETPKLQATDVQYYQLDDLYGDKSDILKPMKNPILKPGDMIIVPEPAAAQSIFFYIQQTIAFVGTLVSFYYLIDNITRRYNP